MNEVLEMERPAAEQRAVAAPAAQPLAVVPTTPFELVAHAAARGASMEELRAFIELQERLEANQARKAYVAAMAEFKRNPPQIMKDKAVGYYNKDGSFTGYRHSTLGAVCGAVVEALGTHGFSHRWDTEQPDSGLIAVTCSITHAICSATPCWRRAASPPTNNWTTTGKAATWRRLGIRKNRRTKVLSAARRRKACRNTPPSASAKTRRNGASWSRTARKHRLR
jgi:hypothetical protein